MARDSKRYLGLELAGAKNLKTAVAVLEYYSKENKVFLLDIFDRVIPQSEHQSSDEALLELIEEISPGLGTIGVNVPLDLPPCVVCTRKHCPMPQKCTVPAVKWMRDFTKKAARNHDSEISDRVREFTPYTQRPIELWARYQLMPKLPESHRFEVDETLGGNKAPLAARMHFLKWHLKDFNLCEVWPKLTIALIAMELGLSKRTVAAYRRLEEGVQAREEILESMTRHKGIFIYERDVRKLSHSLTSFDAFMCAYTALLSDIGGCAKAPHSFPLSSGTLGWIEYPSLEGSR